ncbi:LysR family transcriptional regulator [Actomonas aquatica]|uniref:LysR family transcriptional regulator n=1 Tax=Actomonas aquatica TaxID=2866162 RepID=A0ABZ1C4A8_9BACT|nr:LysR family transcriptional regulator [Opitutus sp. WL0086]WRQ86296.1 LysR family transcriptional regulator [Opitutus sp. WL0086]
MELRHLRTFVAVARHLNFTVAAAELHVAQPAVSQTIRDLEEEMGVTLFQRSKRSVRLTAAGTVFRGEVERILETADGAVRAAQRAARGEVGKLVLGYMGPATTPFLPRVLRAYRELYPDVELVLHEMMPTEQLAAFEQERIDVAFTRPTGLAGQRLWLEEELIYTDRVVAAVPSDHALAQRRGGTLPVKRLGQETLVVYQQTGAMGLYDIIMGMCRRAGIAPRVVQEPDLMPTVVTLVAAGVGIGLVPGCVACRHVPGVEFRELSPRSDDVPLVMAWGRDNASPTLGAFLDVVRELKPAIQAQMEGAAHCGRTS